MKEGDAGAPPLGWNYAPKYKGWASAEYREWLRRSHAGKPPAWAGAYARFWDGRYTDEMYLMEFPAGGLPWAVMRDRAQDDTA